MSFGSCSFQLSRCPGARGSVRPVGVHDCVTSVSRPLGSGIPGRSGSALAGFPRSPGTHLFGSPRRSVGVFSGVSRLLSDVFASGLVSACSESGHFFNFLVWEQTELVYYVKMSYFAQLRDRVNVQRILRPPLLARRKRSYWQPG